MKAVAVGIQGDDKDRFGTKCCLIQFTITYFERIYGKTYNSILRTQARSSLYSSRYCPLRTVLVSFADGVLLWPFYIPGNIMPNPTIPVS